MQVDSNSCGDVVEDGAKTAPDGPSGSPGLLLYHNFVDVNIFVMPRKHHM